MGDKMEILKINVAHEWIQGELVEKDKERIQSVIFQKEGIITLNDFTNLLGLSLGGMKQFITNNKLPYFKLSRLWMIDLEMFWEELKKLK